MSDLESIIALIDAELDRLDVGYREDNVDGFTSDVADCLPDGWIALHGHDESYYGNASAILDALRSALPGETLSGESAFEDSPSHDHRGLLALYFALDPFPTTPPPVVELAYRDGESWEDMGYFPDLESAHRAAREHAKTLPPYAATLAIYGLSTDPNSGHYDRCYRVPFEGDPRETID